MRFEMCWQIVEQTYLDVSFYSTKTPFNQKRIPSKDILEYTFLILVNNWNNNVSCESYTQNRFLSQLTNNGGDGF